MWSIFWLNFNLHIGLKSRLFIISIMAQLKNMSSKDLTEIKWFQLIVKRMLLFENHLDHPILYFQILNRVHNLIYHHILPIQWGGRIVSILMRSIKHLFWRIGWIQVVASLLFNLVSIIGQKKMINPFNLLPAEA